MPNQKRFPAKDADFNNYINIAIPYLTTNKTRLVITTTALADLTSVTALLSTATTGWNSVYPSSQNPAIATTTIIANKNNLRMQIEGLLRTIFADIPKSILTQTDRDTLNIPLPSDTRTPATKPTEVPALSISSRGHLFVNINIVDSASPQSQPKPDGVDSVELEGAFLPISTAPSTTFPQETDFRHLDIIGRNSYTRNYAADQLKGTEYIRARYLNTRNEPGNWSELITVVVS